MATDGPSVRQRHEHPVYPGRMTDSGAPQGWYDDPTRRHQQRYFDGAVWTHHVTSGGVVGVDPIHPGPPAQPGPPAVASPTAVGPNAVASETPKGSFLDSLGRDAVERPTPDFPTAVGGIGGFLVGGGLVALIGQSGEQVAVVIAGLLTFGAALAVMLFVVPKLGFLASPAVSAATVGIFVVAAGLILSDEGVAGADEPFQLLLLAGLLCLVAFVAPGFRGRPLMLGIGLVAVPIALAGLVAGGETCDSFDADCNAFENAAGSAGLSSGAGVVLAALGCAMLFLVRKLDALGRVGMATTVAAACIVNLGIGAFALAVDLGNTGGPLLVAAAGIALGIVGHLGRRRGLTWTGAVLAAGGFVVGVGNLVDPDSSTLGAIVAMVTGVVVIGTPYAFGRIVADRHESPPSAALSTPTDSPV